MTLKERILALIAVEMLDDDELATRLGVVRQQVNQTCRTMEYEGLVTRQRAPAGKIVNRLTDAGAQPPVPRRRSLTPSTPGTPITEDDVKAAVSDWLEVKGFEVAVAWGHDPGIDIEARRGVERWVIEAKGTGGYDQMSRNYFFGVIGSLLQRMTDEHAHYALAIPDVPPFINLVVRFPELARRRTQLSFLLVGRDGDGFSVREGAPPQ